MQYCKVWKLQNFQLTICEQKSRENNFYPSAGNWFHEIFFKVRKTFWMNGELSFWSRSKRVFWKKVSFSATTRCLMTYTDDVHILFMTKIMSISEFFTNDLSIKNYKSIHTQCGNVRIFLSLRFYVKSNLRILHGVQNLPL